MAPRGHGFGILPTPDPTIASTISDEDVALQLMRLGDPSNMSHGRTSTSTMDDALSGRADIASSATSDSDDESEGGPQILNGPVKTNVGISTQNGRHQKHGSAMASTNVSDDDFDSTEHDGPANKRLKLANVNSSQSRIRSSNPHKKAFKSRTAGPSKKTKIISASNAAKVPISPASLPPQSRKTSSASIMGPPQLPFADDDDLSTKPRCQRCRKSKKGCDRQRPCQRCKDAGIGAEGCVSEDEGNGRKGRFGRHMGVSVQKDTPEGALGLDTEAAGAILDGMADAQEKSKKRKR